MEKIDVLAICAIAIFLVAGVFAIVAKPADAGNNKGFKTDCTSMQSGELYGSDGSLINLGYNEWGYNYQAHLFNGDYCDYHPLYRPGGAGHESCMEDYGNVKLVMKWNDAWMSNLDCSGDGLLDRHYGHDGYIGSGAWETNHMYGSYEQDGETCNWDYFVKIVAVPEDAYLEGGIWYSENGVEIGPVIWGEFAVIQEVENDPCAGSEGILYHSPSPEGFGYYFP